MTNGVAPEEGAGRQDGVGQAERRLLLDVGDADAPARPVPAGLPDLVPGVADDDADVADAGVAEGLDPVEEDRLVRDRDELFGLGERQRPEPRALAAAQDQAFQNPNPPRKSVVFPMFPSPSENLNWVSGFARK